MSLHVVPNDEGIAAVRQVLSAPRAYIDVFNTAIRKSMECYHFTIVLPFGGSNARVDEASRREQIELALSRGAKVVSIEHSAKRRGHVYRVRLEFSQIIGATP